MFFSKTVGFETENHVKTYESTGTKMYTNGIGLMAQIASMHIYSKTPTKIFFSRASGPFAMKIDI